MPSFFIDDSRHENFDFVLGAIVYTDSENIDQIISAALVECGLRPNIDEYKSRAVMANNENFQKLRNQLIEIIQKYCKISFFVLSENERMQFGGEAVKGIKKVVDGNDLINSARIYFDQGMFRASKDKDVAQKKLSDFRLDFEHDSKIIKGLQLADLFASHCSQIIIMELDDKQKEIPLGLEAGYPEVIMTKLGWVFRNVFRWNFFGKSVERDNDADWKPELDVFSCIHISPGVNEKIRSAIKKHFGPLWMGCTH